jgi:hypothetical protein
MLFEPEQFLLVEGNVLAMANQQFDLDPKSDLGPACSVATLD